MKKGINANKACCKCGDSHWRTYRCPSCGLHFCAWCLTGAEHKGKCGYQDVRSLNKGKR